MNEPHDPDVTADVPLLPTDSLDAGLAAGFGRPATPRSSLGAMRPVLLRDVEGDSGHVVKPHSDAMPAKSETGDRYQISGEIARGGMGAVLRGRDVDLGRDLAIKVLLEKYADHPEVARRFLEEAQIGGQLQHPGVVPVYDIGRFGDRPFFTMKLVKGQTLAHLLAERADHTKDRPRLLSIALKMAQTLAYAHAKGVIHRDLKPANVMVGAFGEVQVMDWGLAKVLAEGGVADEERASRQNQPVEGTLIRTARSSGTAGSHDTEAGSLLGTPAYIPPEQANGDIANLDRRADVFGLGAILCEMLTGQPPYVGRSTEELRRKAANGDQADALARLDACAADAELIVLTKACLSPEAIDRPKDAQAVADGLTAYLDGVQARLRQAELAEAAARARALEESKRRRLTLALAATVLLAGALGGGGWLWVKTERDARQAQVANDLIAHALFGLHEGKLDEGIVLLQQAVLLQPDLADAHAYLSWLLLQQRKGDKAVVEAQTAIALNPRVGWYHNELGRALEHLGRLQDAVEEYCKALQLPNEKGYAAGNLKNLEAILARIPRLEAARKGEAKPTDAAECIQLAQLAAKKKQPLPAVQLYDTAFATDPKLADDLQAGHRYNAACYASLAAAGQGEDAAKIDAKERARLRQQALDWLRADLAAYTKLLETGPPPARALVQRQMRHWQQDTDLAGIRDAAALAKLPTEEQKAFIQLWADVAALLKKAEEKK